MVCRWTSLYSDASFLWDYYGGVASIVASSNLGTGCVALESGIRVVRPCSQVKSLNLVGYFFATYFYLNMIRKLIIVVRISITDVSLNISPEVCDHLETPFVFTRHKYDRARTLNLDRVHFAYNIVLCDIM